MMFQHLSASVLESSTLEEGMCMVFSFQQFRKAHGDIHLDHEAWTRTRIRAIVHRFLSLAKQDETKKMSIEKLRAQGVSTILITYLYHMNSYMNPLQSVLFILTQLKRSLLLGNSNFSSTSIFGGKDHADMPLWIAITGFWLTDTHVRADALLVPEQCCPRLRRIATGKR